MEKIELGQKTVKYLESYLVTNREVLDREEIVELEQIIGEHKEVVSEEQKLRYFGLHTPGVIVDNRDDSTTWIHVDGVTLEITREQLEGVSDHWVINREDKVLTLFLEDVEELLENMKENDED